MTDLPLECGCLIHTDEGHCCDAYTVDLCEKHQKKLKEIENNDYGLSRKWIQENPVEALTLTQAILDSGYNPLVIRDIVPPEKRDWKPSEHR